MSLKKAVRERIVNEVINSVKGTEWKVLVLDHLSMRMISACSKMTEIMSSGTGITLVEDINKKREPLPTLQGIYLITPTEKSIQALIDDFFNPYAPQYKLAHVFFTDSCPKELFSEICKSSAAYFIKTFKEINIAFLPCESQVFSLETPETFHVYFSPNEQADRLRHLKRCAEQIATLCAAIGEYPAVRYRAGFEKNAEFAQLVQQKLDAYKIDYPAMGQGMHKEKTQLLILDRSVDPISPLLHELTLQAMANDLHLIDNDVYKYSKMPPPPPQSAEDEDAEVMPPPPPPQTSSILSRMAEKEAVLDENDDLWVATRHLHIAAAAQVITKRLREFSQTKRFESEEGTTSLRSMSQIMNKMPQYQKDINRFSMYLHLAESCLNIYQQLLFKLCLVEQSLALGTGPFGNKVKDAVVYVASILCNKHISASNKLRIIFLYIIHTGGVTEESLDILAQHGKVSYASRDTILNLNILGLPVLAEVSEEEEEDSVSHARPYLMQKRKRRSEYTFDTSRWTPYIKDIMEELVEDKLDKKKFPFLQAWPRANVPTPPIPISERYGSWFKEKPVPVKTSPRVIVFMVGGMTMSEMRCAYEVTQANKTFEIIIGSSHILHADTYMQQLKELNTGILRVRGLDPDVDDTDETTGQSVVNSNTVSPSSTGEQVSLELRSVTGGDSTLVA